MYNQILTYSCAGSGGLLTHTQTHSRLDFHLFTNPAVPTGVIESNCVEKNQPSAASNNKSQVGRKLRVVAHGVRPSCEDRNPIKTFFFLSSFNFFSHFQKEMNRRGGESCGRDWLPLIDSLPLNNETIPPAAPNSPPVHRKKVLKRGDEK